MDEAQVFCRWVTAITVKGITIRVHACPEIAHTDGFCLRHLKLLRPE